MTRVLPKNAGFSLPIFPLVDVTPNSLFESVLPTVPRYEHVEFSRLVRNTIGAIHQIPLFFNRARGARYQLKQIEAYFGRSSGSPLHPAQNLYQRLYKGLTERDHQYGMVFGTMKIRSSVRHEQQGINILTALKRNDGLCISNNSFHGGGRVGSTEPGYLYMTFRILRGRAARPARILSTEEILRVLKAMEEEIHSEAKASKESPGVVAQGLADGLRFANKVDLHGEFRVGGIDEVRPTSKKIDWSSIDTD